MDVVSGITTTINRCKIIIQEVIRIYLVVRILQRFRGNYGPKNKQIVLPCWVGNQSSNSVCELDQYTILFVIVRVKKFFGRVCSIGSSQEELWQHQYLEHPRISIDLGVFLENIVAQCFENVLKNCQSMENILLDIRISEITQIGIIINWLAFAFSVLCLSTESIDGEAQKLGGIVSAFSVRIESRRSWTGSE